MFCGKCGEKNVDAAAFCISCGAKLSGFVAPDSAHIIRNATVLPEEPTAPSTPAAPIPPSQTSRAAAPVVPAAPAVPVAPAAPVAPTKRRRKKKLLLIGGISLAVVIALVISGIVLFRSSPRAMATKVWDAYYNADFRTIFSMIHDDVLEGYFGSKSEQREARESYEESAANYRVDMDRRYTDWDISYEVVHVEKITGELLEDTKEYYDEEFDLEVTAVRDVIVMKTLSAEYSKEIMENRHLTDSHVCTSSYKILTFVKIDGQWYLDIRDLYTVV